MSSYSQTPVRQTARPILTAIMDTVIRLLHLPCDILRSNVTLEIGDLCPVCLDIYHDRHQCHHQLAGWCVNCSFYRNVDTWRRCEVCGSNSIADLHIKFNRVPMADVLPFRERGRK